MNLEYWIPTLVILKMSTKYLVENFWNLIFKGIIWHAKLALAKEKWLYVWLFCYIILNYECLGQIKHFCCHLSRNHFKLFTINKLTITFTLEDDNRGNCSSFMVSDSLSFSTSPLFVYFLSYICSARRYRYKLVLFVSWKKRGKVVGLKNFLRFFYRSQIYHLAVLVKNVPLQKLWKMWESIPEKLPVQLSL
jgi:hypothetical protein